MIEGFPLTGIDPTFDYVTFLHGPSRRNQDFHPTHDYGTLSAMKADYLRRGTITVNTAHSERTIFATPDINARFRYWHDLAHIAVNAEFTVLGEFSAALHQIRQVYALKGPSLLDKARWAALIDCEVNGQTAYYMLHGMFPADQRKFAVDYLTRNGWDVSRFPTTLYGLTIEY